MTDFHHIVVDYPSLMSALRARAEQRRMSRSAIDELGGLPSGLAGKILGPAQTKRLGIMSLGSMLGALGLKLIAVPDPEAEARWNAPPRNETVVRKLAVMGGHGKQQLISVRLLRKIAGSGGDARARKLTARRRSEIAQQAALVRWERVKAAARPAQSRSVNR